MEDTTTPGYSDLLEFSDPLELDDAFGLWINDTELSGIDYIYFEYDAANQTMINCAGNTWIHVNWTPSTIGLKYYNIHIVDNSGFETNVSGEYWVEDTTLPGYSDLLEFTDPLTLGENIS